MGIRFNCPNCKRALNVKSGQAGLEGICPTCRTVVKIPNPDLVGVDVNESLPNDLTDEGDDNQDTEEGLDPVARQESEQLDIDVAETESLQNRGKARFRTQEIEEVRESFVLDKPTQDLKFGNPIFDAPNLIWYYRNKEQGERGPLKSKAMQSELEQGKIMPESFVWREDWETWLPASRVFPQLALPSAADSSSMKVRISPLAKVLLRINSNPRYLNVLIVVVCILLLAMIATAIWLVIR